MNHNRQTLARLAAQRPHVEVDPTARAALLQHVLEQPRPAYAPTPARTHTRTRLRLAAASGGLAVAVSAAVVAWPVVSPTKDGGGHSFGAVAYAATPPSLRFAPLTSSPPAHDLLESLAAKAEAQPGTGSGVAYVATKGWFLGQGTVAASTRRHPAEIVPEVREMWQDATGLLRADETRGSATNVDTLSPGTAAQPLRSDLDEDGLENALGVHADEYGTAAWFVAMGDLWSRQIVPPLLQARMLRILSSESDVAVAGSVADRAGRRGLAITTDSSYTGAKCRYVLVMDADTGALLDMETIRLDGPKAGEENPVRAHSTIHYKLYLTSGIAPALGQRPTGVADPRTTQTSDTPTAR